MPAKLQSYPVYIYDEPVTYNDFTGGINTDPSNEHLTDNELRDCVNMHYLSGALVKRKGAKEIAKLVCDTDLFNIQGIFLFTYKITYIIVAADGKLYYGVFNENTDIYLERLRINAEPDTTHLYYNPTYLFKDFIEQYTEDTANRHEGFVHSYEITSDGVKDYICKGKYEDITNDTFYPGDIIIFNNTKYKCLREHKKEILYPTNKDLWVELSYADAYTLWKQQNPLAQSFYVAEWNNNNTVYDVDSLVLYNKEYYCCIQAHRSIKDVTDDGIDDAILPTWTSYWRKVTQEEALVIWGENNTYGSIPDWHENNSEWELNTLIKYKGKYYKCKTSHYNYSSVPIYDITNWEPLKEGRELIFQNYRKIEAATFDNKLYITTGSLFINIELRNNQLVAEPVTPYTCNNTEITLIGYNYLSPYPEYCRGTELNTVTTSIGSLLAHKNKTGGFILEPQMTFQYGESAQDYLYRWEKKINNQWYVIHTFISQDPSAWTQEGQSSVSPISTLLVDDADKYQYRVTFARAFEKEATYVNEWLPTETYEVGTFVAVGSNTYQCLKSHSPTYKDDTGKTIYYGKDASNKIITWNNSLGEFSLTGIVDNEEVQFWKLIHEQEQINYLNILTGEVTQTYDYAIDKVTGEYYGQAVSVLATDLESNETFRLIQSCTKIHVDGNKLLLYGDKYNSGKWFKTIINNPGYITDKGCLSFKTTKNEELIKVVAFQGNIICFANSETVGGSIHLVQGNGDDYDSQDGYYSPYRRNTINASISCDNPNTIQICDNILVFKHFNRVYYINASDLSNEVIQVTPCNDRLLHESKDLEIPWDDNTCISEVTDTYYSLIWKEKYESDENGELILKHPGIRVKMYYKMANKLQDNTYVMPWLRDESDYLNVEHCIYIKGKPLFLYNNVLISFEEDTYTDLNKNYECKIHFRGVDLSYPKMFKIISNVLIYYHRNQYSNMDFHISIRNEAGHLLLDSTKAKKTLQDLKALKADNIMHGETVRLDSTILDTRIINTTYKFPCFLADTIITCENDKEFSLSSITYSYTTIQTPESNPYDLYTSIIRKKDLLSSAKYQGGK